MSRFVMLYRLFSCSTFDIIFKSECSSSYRIEVHVVCFISLKGRVLKVDTGEQAYLCCRFLVFFFHPPHERQQEEDPSTLLSSANICQKTTHSLFRLCLLPSPCLVSCELERHRRQASRQKRMCCNFRRRRRLPCLSPHTMTPLTFRRCRR